jgi:glutamate dehydrogenase (NAD(P)+)
LFWDEDGMTQRNYQVLDRAFGHMIDRSDCDRIFHRGAAMPIGSKRERSAGTTRGLLP